MAVATIHPSRDIYVGAEVTFSAGSTGHVLVDEEVLDTSDYLRPYPQSGGRNYVCGFDDAAVAEIAGATIGSVQVKGRADWCQGWWETPAGAQSTQFLAYLGTWTAENWTGAVLVNCPWTAAPWTSDDIKNCGLRFEARTHRYYHVPTLYQVYLEVVYTAGATSGSGKRTRAFFIGG